MKEMTLGYNSMIIVLDSGGYQRAIRDTIL